MNGDQRLHAVGDLFEKLRTVVRDNPSSVHEALLALDGGLEGGSDPVWLSPRQRSTFVASYASSLGIEPSELLLLFSAAQVVRTNESK